ncbi:MAG: hypothetical protein HKN80_13890, partial [Acidimicrobiia bacterium]|nr:hypothetical protein [Acidimicrobiia bacterium]
MVWSGTTYRRAVSIASVVALVFSLLVAPPSPLASTPAAANTADPIGHWTFDEASSGTGTGTVIDSSGGGNDGTINGGAVYVPGVVGTGALSFDGTDDYVDVGIVPALDLTGGSYTIAFWAKQDGAQLGRIVNMDDGSGSLPLAGYSVFASTDMRVTHSNGGANDFSVPSPFGAWSHTAATYDSVTQTLTLWIDGVDSGSVSVTGGDLTSDGDDPLYFGALRNSLGSVIQHFEGPIDDIRLYDVALSAGEINGLATAPGLNAWSAEGYDFAGSPYVGDWQVSADGRRVSQVSEASAAVFFGGVDAVGSHRVTMRGRGDNDFIGFVLGYQPGDVTNSSSDGTYADGADFLQLDWRRGTQTNSNFSDSCAPTSGGPPIQQEGLTLSHIRGTPTLDELLGRDELADCPGEFGTVDTLAGGNTLGEVGWQSNQSYDFEFEFDGTNLKVWVDGILEFDVDAPAPITGNFVFMARSQAVEFVLDTEIVPSSYEMIGGEIGSNGYLDDGYGQTSALQSLSGGSGDLTDGVIAANNFNSGVLASVPWVGWETIDPSITFNFDDSTEFGSVRIWVDDLDGDASGVNPPASIDVTVGAETRSFEIADPVGASPYPIDLPLGGMVADDQVVITLYRQDLTTTTPNLDDWVFVSEVEFFAPRTIQTQVDAATAGDTITIESLPLLPGLPTLDFEKYNETVHIDKDLIIEGSGVTIDAIGLGDDLVDGVPVITIADGATVTLRNVTIQGGTDSGILIESSPVAGNVTLENVVVTDNVSREFGGGINNLGEGTLTINATEVSNNQANNETFGGAACVAKGGGINSFGDVDVINGSFITGNTADGAGGGIHMG